MTWFSYLGQTLGLQGSMTFSDRAGRQASHAECIQAKTHPDIRLMRPRSVLQRLRTRMGVPRGLIPSATFEDTFTSAASCRRPTRGLQNSQNEYGLPPRPSPISPCPLHSWVWMAKGLVPKRRHSPHPTSGSGRGPGKCHGSPGIINEVGFSGGRE